MSSLLILLACLLGLTVAQPHHGESGTGVTCRDCGGHGPDHEFPACLLHTVTCHHEEVCQIQYGGEHTEVRCHRQEPEDHCPLGGSSHPSSDCPAGGHYDGYQCKLCCNDNSCVADTVSKLTHLASQGLHCPAECPSWSSIQQCLSLGHVCNSHQFCKLSKGEHHGEGEHHGGALGAIHGRCEDNEEIHRCHDEMSGHLHGPAARACCRDQACIDSHFGLTTAPAPTTTHAIHWTHHFHTNAHTTAGDSNGFGTLTCMDFSQMGCATLIPFCPKINCPAECQRCLNPDTTPVTQGTEVPTTVTTTPVTDMPTDGPGITDTVGMTSAGTDKPILESTAVVPPASTPGSTCADTIPGAVACSDLDDVCSSALLAPYCQKYCGLCQ